MKTWLDHDIPLMPGSTKPWLETMRHDGRLCARLLGWPTPHLEAWKYTNLGALARTPFRLAGAKTDLPVASGVLPSLLLESHRLVFVNGHWRPDLSELGSLPAGVGLIGLRAALAAESSFLEPWIAERLGQQAVFTDQALLALNTAFLTDGLVLRVPAGVVLERPVEVLFLAIGEPQPLAWHPRLLFGIGAGGGATVIEHHLGESPYSTFSNSVTELSLEAGAHLRHFKVQAESREAFHIATLQGRLERQAEYEGFLLTLGGRQSRHEVRLKLDGPGARARMNGAYLLRGRQHADITTLMDHAQPECTSRQLFKGVIDQQARGVFQGKVLVRPGAGQTDGAQVHRALLLSDQAELNAKPELEIYADDVKCSHGATVGDLDDEAMFYLRARGIDPDSARALLIGAYVNEALAEISDHEVRIRFETLAAEWLTTRAGEKD